MKPVIFCDFDGTITTKDNIIAIMQKFAPPEWEPIKDQILAQTITIQEGVGRMFSLLPSHLKQEIVDFVLTEAQIRPGFQAFVEFTKQQNIPLYIVSGGIDFFVKPFLYDLIAEEKIYCNSADLSKETIQILWPNECDKQCNNGCGCCKPSIIRKLIDDNDIIVIGDSVTDLQAAKLAHTTFACGSYLYEKCQELGLNVKDFSTFYDIMTEFQEVKVG